MKYTPFKRTRRITLAASVAASALCGVTAQAQSVDALLDKLVDKGVLSTKEANDLKHESDQGFTKAYQVKSGMPDWVTSLRFNGDFRGRFEGFNADNNANFDRTRYRYRMRFGATAILKDNFEVGLRLASADTTGGFGGNPLSANTTLQDGGSRKFVFIDAAYAKWTPLHNGPWMASAIIGKMDNPFQISNMVFDYDYQPEGAALQTAYNITDSHKIKFNAGFFSLDELNQATLANPSPNHDPYLLGAQLIWEAKWTKKIDTSLGVSVFSINNRTNLDNASVPNVNGGNTRSPAGYLVYGYNPIVASAAVTYKLESFPVYKGEFPIRVSGEFMKNPAAPTANQGMWAGIMFGKAGRKGTWDVSYRYQRLEGDAWYEEVVDDDNVGYYQQQLIGDGFNSAANVPGAGVRGGTNVKGHLIKANYSFTDALTMSLIFYANRLVSPSPGGSTSAATHFMIDMTLKF